MCSLKGNVYAGFRALFYASCGSSILSSSIPLRGVLSDCSKNNLLQQLASKAYDPCKYRRRSSAAVSVGNYGRWQGGWSARSHCSRAVGPGRISGMPLPIIVGFRC